MSAFSRITRRFVCQGIGLNYASDALPPGKWPLLQNARSYQEGTLQGRDGLVAVAGASFGGVPVHTLGRLNDSTAYAATPFWRIFASAANLFAGTAGAYPQIDTGYSGNPLALVAFTPIQSPEPWMYVADASRMRKFDVNGHLAPVGVAPPLTAPTSYLNPLYFSVLSDFSAGVAWVAAGTAASAPAAFHRVNTTIFSILYDTVGTGVSVTAVNMNLIDVGALITFNGIETLPVQQVTIAVVPTTIAAIIYDAGTSGLCTIQPAGSLGTGQLDTPSLADYVARGGNYASVDGTAGIEASDPDAAYSPDTAHGRIRQIDFPVNSIVSIGGGGGAENVRILSVALGPDGVQSFRCATVNTHGAGNTITGVAAFRVQTAVVYAPGVTLVDDFISNVITPVPSADATAVASATAGVQTGVAWVPDNSIATINGIPTLGEDDLHLCVRFSDCTAVQTIRVYFDIDVATNDFTENYLFFEWRANDIVAAIQASNTQAIASVQDSRSQVITNTIINDPVALNTLDPNTNVPAASAALAISSQLALGNSQWIELRCKVKDLTRVGTDPTRTLQNIVSAEILLDIVSPDAVQVDYDALYVSGGYGPDTGILQTPMVWSYRYRSSLTGAKSNPSPAVRGGLIPRRQAVALQGTHSSDTTVDLVDWFRIGGAITRLTYVGTGSNGTPPTYVDNYGDASIDGGESLDFDYWQPWPTTDLPRTGTCNVAGSAISRVSGAAFNTSWSPGTAIIVNGQVYTLYSQPPTTALLYINENAGSGSGVAFTIPNPTIIGQPLRSLWGDLDGVYFACGDPNNPGTVYWSCPYDLDRTSDANTVIVTGGSDALQSGCMWDKRAFVFSGDDLYNLAQIQRPDGTIGFRADVTPCGRGLWAPWAFDTGPEGIFFLAEDGIYLTQGGGVAKALTDADLYPLFPHDGAAATSVVVNGVTYSPPDMTQTTRLRLAYIDDWLYFDYVDTLGAGRTLALHVSEGSWWPDLYTPSIVTRYSSPGAAVREILVGGSTGLAYTSGGPTDNGSAIACRAQVIDNAGDPRRQKIYRDVFLDGDLTGSTVKVQLGFSNNATQLTQQTLAAVSGRSQYLVNADAQIGDYGSNLTIDMQWAPASAVTPVAPIFYVWDYAFQPAPELASNWLSGPTTHGGSGYQHVAYALIAYRSSGAVTFSLIVDGVAYTYALPSTAGLYAKKGIWLQTVKGLTFQYGMQGGPFQLFDQDCEFWVQQWGAGGGYSKVRAF